MAGSATTYGDETMSNLETTVALDKFSSRVEEEISTNTSELRDDQLNKVHGGLNPQPLPPRYMRFI
jgi:hypothetical protein